jgi:pyruvate dehydrogenase E2 component (dihydrolipoamide acetyltransferase)
MIKEFRLPVLGENIEAVEISQILISPGDAISKEQIVMAIETDKATVEIPSSLAGKIKALHVKEGDRIDVGQLIFTIETETEEVHVDPATSRIEEKTFIKPERPEPGSHKTSEPSPETVEGTIPLTTTKTQLPESKEYEEIEVGKDKAQAPFLESPSETVRERQITPATPTVRRFAREIGIDINEVAGTGPGGRISIEDVKRFSRDLSSRRIKSQAHVGEPPALQMPDFSKWGDIRFEPMSNIRRSTATHMYHAWVTIPHVTQYDKADITELEKLRKNYTQKAPSSDSKLTITAILLEITASALKIFPKFNASIDTEKNEIIYKNYCHIGIAVDTDRGLLVPVIRDVNKKNILEIGTELNNIAERARDRKLTLEEMQGGTFTITNLGGIGGTYFAPIINWPQVAILGISRSLYEPVVYEGEIRQRLMLPMSVSYDHRIIDGADAARFLRWIADALEQPFLIALEG